MSTAPTTGTSGNALSPLAQKAGGALARIFSDERELARYASSDLSRRQQRSIGNAVAEYPKLNTEAGVGSLIWLTSYHGVTMRQIRELFDDYLISDIELVFEYLIDSSVRTTADSIFVNENEEAIDTVEDLLKVLEAYRVFEPDMPITSSEHLHDIVTRLGGLESLSQYDNHEDLREALDHRKE